MSPLLRRNKADSAAKNDTVAARDGEDRSISSLAKMDVGDLVRLIRRPRGDAHSSRPGKAPKSPKAGKAGKAARGGQLVGVDIEPGYLTAVQVSVNGGITVERAAGIALAPEIVRDGEVVDVAGLAKALSDLFDQHKFDRRVRLGLANQRIVVRTLELPPIADRDELATAVRFQAQNELPMSLDSAVLDFHALGIEETEAGPRQRVVLVAARREMVERLVVAAREAGLRPQGVDLSAFALIRSLYDPKIDAEQRVVYLALGGLGNLAVAQGVNCIFTRVLSVGLESIAGDLAERLGVAVGDARHMLARVGLAENAGPSPEDSFDELPAEGDADAIARAIVVEGVRRIAVEIRNSLHYHSMHGGDGEVSRVVVTGAMTEIPGLVAALGAELELDLEVRTVRQSRPGALGGVPAERLAVAAGLAVSEVPA